MSSPTIVWFRHDLRLDDNPALAAAVARGPVVPVFIWAPEEEHPWEPGAASRWWLHQSLEKLAAALGSTLSVEDLHDIVEVMGVDAHNRRIAERTAKRRSG